MEVVAVPAWKRSREHRARLVLLKPMLVSLVCPERQELVKKVNFTVHQVADALLWSNRSLVPLWVSVFLHLCFGPVQQCKGAYEKHCCITNVTQISDKTEFKWKKHLKIDIIPFILPCEHSVPIAVLSEVKWIKRLWEILLGDNLFKKRIWNCVTTVKKKCSLKKPDTWI